MNALCETWPYTADLTALREADDFDPASAEEADFVVQILTASRSRDALTPKQRALTALAAATVVRPPSPDIRSHVRFALETGATRDEIVSTIVEAALYAGFASAHAALEAAFAVFRKLDGAGAAGDDLSGRSAPRAAL